MPCYSPLQAVFSLRPDGLKDIKFSDSNARAFVNGVKLLGDNNLSIPCGRCMGCRLERSRQWALRCLHESKCYEDNCFVTLTYANEYLPKNGSLDRDHVQRFLKRLRFKYFGRKIRYFYCGEYGDRLSRPHYHLCLFNFDFKDKERFYFKQDCWHYTSRVLSNLWKFGHSELTDFSFETAAYCARYCTKKFYGKESKDYYGDKIPEFAGMSLKPGIGHSWFQKYGKSDLFPHDNVICRGAECKPPRYYDILREREDPEGFAKAKELRKSKGELLAPDNTFKRLAVRFKCKQAKVRLLVRRFERDGV